MEVDDARLLVLLEDVVFTDPGGVRSISSDVLRSRPTVHRGRQASVARTQAVRSGKSRAPP